MTGLLPITGVVLGSGAPGEYDTNGDDFDMLRDAVIAAGLDGTLNDPFASLTVFAPNDDAFVGLAQTLGYSGSDEAGSFAYIVDSLSLLGGGDAIPLLTEILTYHVVDGAFDLNAVVGLGDGAEIGTLQGGNLTLDLGTPSLGDLDPGLPDPTLIGFDVMATNGIIHVLDGVLLPLAVSDILSQPGTDFVIAGDDDDRLKGGKGDDFLSGKDGEDRINGGKGDDVILGGNDDDRLSGRQDDDILRGEDGDDVLRGNQGKDLLDGGLGDDTLVGNGGADVFVFSEGYGEDLIRTFQDGVDKIDVSGFGFTSFEEFEDAVSSRGQRTEIDFGDGDVLTISGVSAANLDASDFIFA